VTSQVYPGLQIIIDHLRTIPETDFDMNEGGEDSLRLPYGTKKEITCKSPCCIGGHARILLYNKIPEKERDLQQGRPLHIEQALAKLCDVPSEVAVRICYKYPHEDEYNRARKKDDPWGHEVLLEYDDFTLQDAITMLEHCRDTGETIWPK